MRHYDRIGGYSAVLLISAAESNALFTELGDYSPGQGFQSEARARHLETYGSHTSRFRREHIVGFHARRAARPSGKPSVGAKPGSADVGRFHQR